MVLTRKEHRSEISRRIGWGFTWEVLVTAAVFGLPWGVRSYNTGRIDWPSVSDFIWATVAFLGMEMVRRLYLRPATAYEIYRETAERADAAEVRAQRFQDNQAHANWYEISGRFVSLREYGIKAERVVHLENGEQREVWELEGDSEPHKRSFRAVCELAGDTLTISKVWPELPQYVRDAGNPFIRWLRYVEHKEGMTESGSTAKYAADGALVPESTSWRFNDDLAMASKRLCQDNLLRDRMVNSQRT